MTLKNEKEHNITYITPWNVPEKLASSSVTRSALSKDGVKPSPNKVSPIENLEPGKDKKELHTF